MSYPPPGGQDPYQPLPGSEPPTNPYGTNPYAQPAPPSTPPPAYQSYPTYSPYPAGGTPTGGSNGLAIASMVTGIVAAIVSLCGCWPLGFLGGGTAAALGFVGMNQIKERGQSNRGMAIAGIATGVAAILIGAAWLIVALTVDTSNFWTDYDLD